MKSAIFFTFFLLPFFSIAQIKPTKPSIKNIGDSTKVYRYVEEMPVFPGGKLELQKFFTSNLQFDSTSYGRAFVSGIIDKTGRFTQPTIVKSTISPQMQNKILALFPSMPLWKPGKMSGKYVNVRTMIPVILSKQ